MYHWQAERGACVTDRILAAFFATLLPVSGCVRDSGPQIDVDALLSDSRLVGPRRYPATVEPHFVTADLWLIQCRGPGGRLLLERWFDVSGKLLDGIIYCIDLACDLDEYELPDGCRGVSCDRRVYLDELPSDFRKDRRISGYETLHFREGLLFRQEVFAWRTIEHPLVLEMDARGAVQRISRVEPAFEREIGGSGYPLRQKSRNKAGEIEVREMIGPFSRLDCRVLENGDRHIEGTLNQNYLLREPSYFAFSLVLDDGGRVKTLTGQEWQTGLSGGGYTSFEIGKDELLKRIEKTQGIDEDEFVSLVLEHVRRKAAATGPSPPP